MVNPINHKFKHRISIMLVSFITLIMLQSNNTYSQSNKAPQTIIKSFTVNNIEYIYSSNFNFKPDENNIQITYEGIDLTFSGNVMYSYRMQNSQNWDTTYANILTFPGLTAGEYEFSIKSKTASSQWSNTETLNFTILKPAYLQLWFILLVSFILVSLISFFIFYKNKQYLNRERNALILQQKMNEMENQAKQAMMNPHFVFNALNSIQHYMLENDKESTNKYLTKFSRLIRMNLDLSTKSVITLEEELEKLKLYLEIEQLRFGDKLVYDFKIDNQLETDIIQIPSMILQPFVENAIWHGIMPANRVGQITIVAEAIQNNQMLSIKILDNGIGIANAKNLTKPKTHKSMGSQITIDRMMLFGQQHHVKCNVIVSDNLEGGTIISLQLPLVINDL